MSSSVISLATIETKKEDQDKLQKSQENEQDLLEGGGDSQEEPGVGDIDNAQVEDIHFQSVMAMFQVNPVPHFDPSGDPNSLCQKWEKWVRGYELYMGASGITADGQKRQYSCILLVQKYKTYFSP